MLLFKAFDTSVLRQEWVEESHFCEGYFCALFAMSAGVLRFASHRKPGGFRNTAMREGRVSCVWSVLCVGGGEGQVGGQIYSKS